MPIWAFVFMTMLASQPMMPPMMIVTIQPMLPSLSVAKLLQRPVRVNERPPAPRPGAGRSGEGQHTPSRHVQPSSLAQAIARRQLLLPALLMTASITRSRLKLPGFWRGGNSLKLWSHWPT